MTLGCLQFQITLVPKCPVLEMTCQFPLCKSDNTPTARLGAVSNGDIANPKHKSGNNTALHRPQNRRWFAIREQKPEHRACRARHHIGVCPCARRPWVTEVPKVVECPRVEAQRSRTWLSAGVLTCGPGNLQQGHGGWVLNQEGWPAPRRGQSPSCTISWLEPSLSKPSSPSVLVCFVFN